LRKTLIAAAAVIVALGASGFAERPPGARPVSGTDEAGLWAEVDKAEVQARTNGDINSDKALNDYVTGVACRVAKEYCSDIRVYVMDRPVFNAQMAPNGYSEVWSGLMLRATSEAEFAFVISHEVTHFAENHSVEAMRAQRNRANVALALQVGVAIAGVAAAAGAGTVEGFNSIMDSTRTLMDVIYLSSISSFFAYSRSQENEADMKGFDRAVAAGYEPAAASALWRDRIAETDASDFDKVRRGDTAINAFRSHPLDDERLKAIAAKSAGKPPGDLGQDRYRAAIRPHLSDWLRADLRRRDYGETLHIIDRLTKSGEDLGTLNYFRGEAFRLRQRDPADLDRSLAAYALAVEQADAPAAAWRELGEMHRKGKNAAAARLAFEAYLSKTPDAEDAWLVKDTLKGL